RRRRPPGGRGEAPLASAAPLGQGAAMTSTARASTVRPGALSSAYTEVRAFTEELARPLSPEDAGLQSMPDASPTKWHLAHTTWFFETFVLAKSGEPAFDPSFGYLFNSYYEAVGPRHCRARRGMLSRPSLAEVLRYRADVDARM